MTSLLKMVRPLATYVSVIVVICGALTLAIIQVQAFRLDGQIERGAVHTTQEEDANFHREFWSRFEIGATVLAVGCLALSLTLTSGTAFKAGWWTLGLSIILLFGSWAVGAPHGGYSGATAFTIAPTVFCVGAVFLIVGGLRLGYTKLRHGGG
jgi:lipopolysaccharide export LptBFGC system permease protein LptF